MSHYYISTPLFLPIVYWASPDEDLRRVEMYFLYIISFNTYHILRVRIKHHCVLLLGSIDDRDIVLLLKFFCHC